MIAYFVKIDLPAPVEKIVEEIALERVIEKRRNVFESMGERFTEIICYRSGKTNSFKDELSEETQILFDKYEKIRLQTNC